METRDNPRSICLEEIFTLSKPEERIQFLLQFAILAPSTHNSQPWLFKIKDNTCLIFYNPDIDIKYADPTGRDLYISIGCAITNLLRATQAYGFNTQVQIGPFENKHVATITFSDITKEASISKEDLEIIQTRINARGIFRDQEVPEKVLEKISNIAHQYNLAINFLKTKEKVRQTADITAHSIETIYHNKAFRKEMSAWMHNSLSPKKTGLHGYALKIPFLLSFLIPTLVRFVDIGKKLAGLNAMSISSAPVIAIISSENNNPETWVYVGMAAEEIMLEVNRANLDTSIYVASIEIGDNYKKIQKLANIAGRPHFLFSIGKIDSRHKQTPRQSVNSKLI